MPDIVSITPIPPLFSAYFSPNKQKIGNSKDSKELMVPGWCHYSFMAFGTISLETPRYHSGLGPQQPCILMFFFIPYGEICVLVYYFGNNYKKGIKMLDA